MYYHSSLVLYLITTTPLSLYGSFLSFFCPPSCFFEGFQPTPSLPLAYSLKRASLRFLIASISRTIDWRSTNSFACPIHLTSNPATKSNRQQTLLRFFYASLEHSVRRMHRGRANLGKSSIMHNGLMPSFGGMKRRAVVGVVATPEAAAKAAAEEAAKEEEAAAGEKRPRSEPRLDDIDEDEGPRQSSEKAAPSSSATVSAEAEAPKSKVSVVEAPVKAPSAVGSNGANSSSIAAFSSDTVFRRRPTPKAAGAGTGPANSKFLGSFFR